MWIRPKEKQFPEVGLEEKEVKAGVSQCGFHTPPPRGRSLLNASITSNCSLSQAAEENKELVPSLWL